MTMAKSQGICLLGITAAVLGATGLLLPLMPTPWPHALLAAGLVLVNMGLFWMCQLVSPEQYHGQLAASSQPVGAELEV